jgi:hypothetical protein
MLVKKKFDIRKGIKNFIIINLPLLYGSRREHLTLSLFF